MYAVFAFMPAALLIIAALISRQHISAGGVAQRGVLLWVGCVLTCQRRQRNSYKASSPLKKAAVATCLQVNVTDAVKHFAYAGIVV